MEEEISGVKKRSQLVVVEHNLLRGLQTYATGDAVNCKDDINAQIKSLHMGGLKSSDLHKGLWTLCLKATRGHPLA